MSSQKLLKVGGKLIFLRIFSEIWEEINFSHDSDLKLQNYSCALYAIVLTMC